MINIITWIGIIAAAVMILLSTTLFRRKGEAELSQSLTQVPLFKIAVVIGAISIIAKIICAIKL